MQRNWFAAVFLHFNDLFWGHIKFGTQLFRGGLTTKILHHLTLHTGKFVDHFYHVDWDADGASLIGHGTSDCLTDPPSGISGEFATLGVVKLLHCVDESEVSFMDEIQEQHASTGEAFGQRYDQTKVCLEQVVLGTTSIRDNQLHVTTQSRVGDFFLLHFVLCVESGFDPRREIYFFFSIELSDFTGSF